MALKLSMAGNDATSDKARSLAKRAAQATLDRNDVDSSTLRAPVTCKLPSMWYPWASRAAGNEQGILNTKITIRKGLRGACAKVPLQRHGHV